MTAVVQVRDASIGYGVREVLSSVDLTVTLGEVVAILGANGSGKSTLVRGILNLVPVTTGQVRLFGIERDSRAMRRAWPRIGYVPQRLGAGGGVPATVTEVVTSGRLARRGLLRPAGVPDRTAIAAALAAVGLTDRALEPVGSLSGGQQQRTLIARALAAEPELLILDEPTAGVDAASQDAFAAALRRFVEGGGTVLVVAHELGPLEPLVTRAVVVHNGTVTHDGSLISPVGAAPHHALARQDPPGLWTS
jgi:zinc transport system ATP-binding protein